MKPIVVAFTGKRGSGKSEAVRALVEELGFRELKFADPLKNMLRAMYKTCGVDSITIERKIEGDLKEVPCDWLMGQTPRFAMQTIGTEWRELINTELWSEMFRKAVLSGNLGQRIACSDFRFPHEGVVIDSLGGMRIRVERPSADALDDPASQHSSETLIDGLAVDWSILNNRSLTNFRKDVLAYVKGNIGDRVSGPDSDAYDSGAIISRPRRPRHVEDGLDVS